MKLFWKTLGWAFISGFIFFISAILSDCHWQGALAAASVATLSKTPAYPIWEIFFERLWRKKKPKKEPCFLGEAI